MLLSMIRHIMLPILFFAAAAFPLRAEDYSGRILGDDGRAISNAQVYLLVYKDRDYAQIASTRSRPDGTFTFSNIDPPASPAGYLLLATARDHAMASASAWAGGDNELTLAPATSISIRLLDTAGKPAPNLAIRIRMINSRRPGLSYISIPSFLADQSTSKTDANGQCTFDSIPPASFLQFHIDDPRFVQLSYEDQVPTPDSPDAPVAVVHLKPASSISGTLTYATTGKPAPGVRVLAQSIGVGGGWAESITTDKGEYHLRQLPPGHYNVEVFFNEDTDPGWTAPAVEPVTLTQSQDLANHNIQLIKGVLITGRVTLADTGAAVANVRVGLVGPSRPRSSGAVSSTLTRADGTYVLRTPPGDQQVYIQDIPPDGYSRPKPQDITIAEGQTAQLDISLPRKPGKPVSGQVVGPDGRPMPGAAINAQPANPEGFQEGSFQRADAQGRFHFAAITPGTKLTAARAALETPEPYIVNGGEEDVVLKLSHPIEFTLTGIVVDENSNPVKGAKVGLTVWEGQFGTGRDDLATTDEDGRYKIPGLKPGNRYTVTAKADGFGQASQPVKLTPEEGLIGVDPLELPAATARIAGRVLDDKRKQSPVAGARVYINSGKTGYQTTTTDAQGRFSFKVLPNDRMLVGVEQPNARPDQPTAVNAQSGDENLELIQLTR